MTSYTRLSALPPRRDDYAGPDAEALPPTADPTTPGVTIYYDQSQGGTEPGAGGPPVAWRVYYDASVSGLQASNVQDALDLLDNQVDNITGASSSLDARVTTLEAEMDTAQADIIALQGRMTAAESNIAVMDGSIDALTSRVDTTETDIAALQGRVTTAEGNIINLQGRMTTTEGNVTNLQGRMTSAEVTIANHSESLTNLWAAMGAVQAVTGQATEATQGVAKIATNALVTAGTDDTTIITPLKLATRLVSFTYGQATEAVAGIAEIATQAEVTAGADDARIVTPLKLAQALASSGYVLKAGDTMTGPLFVNYAGAATGFDNTRDIHIKNALPGRQASILIENTAVSWHARMTFKNTIRSWTMGITQSGQAPFQIIDLTAAGAPVRMAIDENGNVGIGAAPQSGTIRTYITNSVDHTGVRIEAGGTAKWAQLFLKNSVREYGFNTDNAGAFILFDNTAGAPRMSIDNSGQVAFYHNVVSIDASQPSLRYRASSVLRAETGYDAGNARWYLNMYDAAGVFQTTLVSATATGFGIRGLVNPGVFFQVNGTGTTMAAIVSSGTAQSLNLHLQDAGYHWEIVKHTDNSFRIRDDNAGGAERLVINGGAGEVGIGGTPMAANVTLSVRPMASQAIVYVGDTTGSWADLRLQNSLRHWGLQCMGTGYPGALRIFDATLGKDRFLIDTNGVLHLKAGSTIVYDLAA